jgi:hypothetical protein
MFLNFLLLIVFIFFVFVLVRADYFAEKLLAHQRKILEFFEKRKKMVSWVLRVYSLMLLIAILINFNKW